MTSYLNTENIARSKGGVEYHPLRPFLPERAKVLFLGSFPPQRKRWCMDFYYPNFINDHWIPPRPYVGYRTMPPTSSLRS